jgi:autotransporter-associated beta strand protein
LLATALHNGGGTNVTNLAKIGGGTWRITGANDYTGTTTVSGGTLFAGAVNTLPIGSTLVVSGGTLNMVGFDQSVGGLTISSGSISGAANTLTSATAFDVRGGTINTNLAGGVALNKTTSGIATLSGTGNSYTGATNVNAGTLLVNGSLSGSSAVTVNSTATLGGKGSISSPVTVSSGGTLSAGVNAAADTLTLQTLTLSSGSNVSFALGSSTNDMLNVTAAGGMTLPSGGAGNMATIKLAGGGGSTPYHLIEFNGGANGGSLTLNSGNVSTYFNVDPTTVDSATLSVSTVGPNSFIDVVVAPLSRTWNITGSGNWSTATNWIGPSPNFNTGEPNGVGAGAAFGSSISADSTVTLDNGNKTVGSLTFNNSAFHYTVAASGGNKLILDGVGTIPLTVANGTHTISAPIQLNKDVNVTATNSGDSLTLSGAITGTNTAITTSGAGTVNISGAVTTGGAFTNNNTGNVTVGAIQNPVTAGITNTGSGNLTLAGIISGGSGAITNNGSGTIAITGTANTWNGKVFLNSGTLAVAANGSLGGASGTDMITMGTGTTLRLLPGASLTNARGITIPKDGNVFIDVPSGSATWQAYPTLSPNTTGGTQTTITKTGSGLLDASGSVQGNPNYNILAITGGTYQIASTWNFSPTPSDNIILTNGGGFAFNATGITSNASCVLTVDSGGGSLLSKTGTSTWSGSIVDGAATGTLTLGGAGTLVLPAFNSYSGGSIINGTGTLTLGADGALGTGPVTWNGGSMNGTLERNVSNEFTINGNVTVSGPSNFTFSASSMTIAGATRTLTVRNGTTTISSNIGEDAPGRGLTKAGTGTLILGGANTYSGNTTIAAGILQINDTTNLGSATNTLAFTGGTLQTNGPLSSAGRNVTVNGGGGTLDDTGNPVTFGNVDGTSAFTKNSGGTLTVNHIRSGNLTVNGGSVVMVPDSTANGVSHVAALNLVGASTKLDLAANKLITTSAAGTWDGTQYTGVTGLVVTGKGVSNNWDGPSGIVTTQTQAVGSNYTSIGVAKASDVRPATATATDLWAGQTITGTDTLVMYTYGGDATLDGKINIDDYVKIDSGIAGGYTGWVNGDFNYDGKVSIDDYITVIDANIGNQNGTFFTSGGVAAGGGSGVTGVTAVPEPVAGSLLILPALAMLQRRRSRRTPAGR